MNTRTMLLMTIAALSIMWIALPANAQQNFGPWSYLLEQPNDQAPHREMMNQRPRRRSPETRQNRWNNQQFQEYSQRGMNRRGEMTEPQNHYGQGFRNNPQYRMNRPEMEMGQPRFHQRPQRGMMQRGDMMMEPQPYREQRFQQSQRQMNQRRQQPDSRQHEQWGQSEFQQRPQRGMNQRQQTMRQQPWQQSEFQGRPQRGMGQRRQMMNQQYQGQPEPQSRRQRPNMMNQQRPGNRQQHQQPQSQSLMPRQGRFTPVSGRDGTVSPQYQAFKRQNLHGASEMARRRGDTPPKQGQNVRQRGQNDTKSNKNVCPHCGQSLKNQYKPQGQNRQDPANQSRQYDRRQNTSNTRSMRHQRQNENNQQNWGNHLENRRFNQNRPNWPKSAPQDEMNMY